MSIKLLHQPNLQDALEELKIDIKYSFNCHRVGTIEKFDPLTQSAEIQLVDKIIVESRNGDEKTVSFPLLIHCPVMINKSAKGGLTFPIDKGDTCLVLFNDRDIDNWYINGTSQPPTSPRAHDLSDGIAIVGIRHNLNAIQEYNNLETKLSFEKSSISLTDKIEIKNDLDKSSISLSDKIEIKNDVTNLTAIIEKIVDALTLIGTYAGGQPALPMSGTLTTADVSAITAEMGKLLK